MLENSVVQISTGKLLGASLLPSSLLLVSGIIIWRIWRNKQSRLQTKTDALNDELRQIKKQMADLQTANNKAESNKSTQTVSTSATRQTKQKSGKSPGGMGLFEYLIEDNIQLRQSTS
jgi:ABC-type transport system involved in cytochrome bd biosynthesis fused ATPase/permease subunit